MLATPDLWRVSTDSFVFLGTALVFGVVLLSRQVLPLKISLALQLCHSRLVAIACTESADRVGGGERPKPALARPGHKDLTKFGREPKTKKKTKEKQVGNIVMCCALFQQTPAPHSLAVTVQPVCACVCSFVGPLSGYLRPTIELPQQKSKTKPLLGPSFCSLVIVFAKSKTKILLRPLRRRPIFRILFLKMFCPRFPMSMKWVFVSGNNGV